MSDPVGLEVDGGTGGTTASLQDLLAAAGALDTLGDEVRAVAGRVLATASALPLASLLLSPTTGAQAAGALAVVVTAPHGLLARSLELEAVAHGLRAAADTYLRADALCAVLFEEAQRRVGVAGTMAFAGLGLERYALAHAAAAVPAPAPLHLWLRLRADATGRTPAEALGRDLYALPWMTGLVVGGLRELVGPTGSGPLTGVDYEQGVALLVAGAHTRGWLDDGPVVVPGQVATPPGSARAPAGVGDLFEQQVDLMRCEPSDGTRCLELGPGRIRILQVGQPGGQAAWIVELPGTQAWGLRSGPNPLDVTSDLGLLAGTDTPLGRAVAQALSAAMREAGVSPGEQPVMLVGHSQGGILAGALASSARFRRRFHVTHVVTGGAPISRMPIPSSVSVLALEHVQDPVPRLDQRGNPDRAAWVTVRRDLGASGLTAVEAHDSRRYRATGTQVDRSDDPSLAHWRRASRRFLGGRLERSWDFRLQRRPAGGVPQLPTPTG